MESILAARYFDEERDYQIYGDVASPPATI